MEIEDLKVKGNTYQETREGYNLFNADREFPFTQIGLTFSKNEDGSVTINGTSTAAAHIYLSTGYSQEEQEAMSGKNYSLKVITTGIGKTGSFGLKYGGSSDRFYVFLPENTGEIKKTAVYTKQENDTGALYWSLLIGTDTTFTNYTIYPCLVEGIEYKDYEKYGVAPTIEEPSDIHCATGDVEVAVRNKNLIKFAKEDWIKGYFNSDGSVNTWEGLIDSKYYVIPSNFDKFTLSIMPLKNFNIGRFYISYYDSNKTPLIGINPINNFSGTEKVKAVKTFANNGKYISENAKYFRIGFKWLETINGAKLNITQEFYNYISELQLEVGTEATEYVPYEGEEFTLNLGTLELLQGEYLHKISNKWYKHKVYEKIVSYNNEEITTDYISTTGELSEGATVYYKLANEVDEEITDETLIAQLEALNKAKTYKKITHIDSVTDELKPILSFEYKQDLETVRENDKKELQDEINNLREAIVALGGV